jgi:hypothetical protein
VIIWWRSAKSLNFVDPDDLAAEAQPHPGLKLAPARVQPDG